MAGYAGDARKKPRLGLTRLGRGFALLMAGLLLGSINYSNNLSFLMTFLLAGMALASVFASRRMVREAVVSPVEARPVFAGAMAAFEISLNAAPGSYHLALPGGEEQSVEPGQDGEAKAILECPAGPRGVLMPGSIGLRCDHPFGLVQARMDIPFAGSCLVYPRPLPGHDMPRKLGQDKDRDALGQAARGRGVDDFEELRDYRPGDSPRHVDWRASSKARNLIVRQFTGTYGGRLHFSYDGLAHMGMETALSILCAWILEAEEEDVVFGLSLPGREIPPGSGKAHCRSCLKLLALHGAGVHGSGWEEDSWDVQEHGHA